MHWWFLFGAIGAEVFATASLRAATLAVVVGVVLIEWCGHSPEAAG